MRYSKIVEWVKVDMITLIFMAEWGLYLAFEAVLGRFTSWRLFLLNLLPFGFFYLVALALKGLAAKIKRPLRMQVIVVWVAVLVVSDQLVKLAVKTLLAGGRQIALITDWLYLTPILNDHGSFLTARFDWKVGIAWMILVNILALFFFVQGYRYYVQKKRNSFWVNVTLILFLAGGIASLIDKTFFGGSLDFLGLKGLFVADLKDFYLTIGLGCAVVELFEYPENEVWVGGLKAELRSIGDFLRFCFAKKKEVGEYGGKSNENGKRKNVDVL